MTSIRQCSCELTSQSLQSLSKYLHEALRVKSLPNSDLPGFVLFLETVLPPGEGTDTDFADEASSQ